MRKITRTKSFVKQLKNWQEYKITSIEDLQHYIRKLRIITAKIIVISEQETFPGKQVNYKNSKGIYYFSYQQHTVFFKLEPDKLTLLYFITSKRIKQAL